MNTSSQIGSHFCRTANCIAFGIGLMLSASGWIHGQSAGSVIWSQTPGGQILAGPAELPDGAIVVGSMSGYLHAFSKDGTPRWSAKLGNDIRVAPAVGPDGTIYVGVDGRLVAVNPNGVEQWAFATRGHIRSSPAVAADGSICFGSNDEKLYMLNSGGHLRWSYATGGEIASSPAIGADGTVYCGSSDNMLHAVRRDGMPRWVFEANGNVDSSPAIGPDGIVLVGSNSRYLYALSTNGVPRWEYKTSQAIVSSPVVGPDDTIYLGAKDGRLYAFTSYGELKWTFTNTTATAFSSPAVGADGAVYVSSAEGKVYAINPNGIRLWLYSGTNSMSGGALTLMSDGTVVVGLDNGQIKALKGGSGPAVSSWPMFRRDARHNASSFVLRQLAPTYSPGLSQVVSLLATPPPCDSEYFVEDQPPSGWTVGTITHEGQWDAQNGRVKFGPFADALPRLLQYELVPGLRESGTKYYGGSVGVGIWSGTPLGDFNQTLLPLHPADLVPTDGRITLQETTVFILGWQNGSSWPAGPSSIPGSYVDKAVALWRQGETYRYNSNALSAPAWWINATSGPTRKTLSSNEVAAPIVSNGPGTGVVHMPVGFEPSITFSVTIDLRPAANVGVYAVEDAPPAGWSVSRISGGGTWDSWNKKVKWGPFFDGEKRQVSYDVTPADSSTNQAVFAGTASFNGTNTLLVGQREVFKGASTNIWVQRRVPDSYAPQWRLTVVLTANPPPEVGHYLVEDAPPAGWSVTQIEANGVYDAARQVVRFGPFTGGTPQELSYDLLPPTSASGTQYFIGQVQVDDREFMIGGTEAITGITLHPADQNPVNSVLSLNEVTAYAATWKSGSNWVVAPNPIPWAYVTNAIDLWKQGEGYQFLTNAPTLPLAWTPDASRVQPGPASLNTNLAPATDCTALAILPANYVAGQPLLIQLQITPAANVLVYGVEDVPPVGWPVRNISDNGWFDPLTGKVKWGPFFDHNSRLLAYELMSDPGGTNLVTFAGIACFDRRGLVIGGSRQTAPFVPAHLEVVGFNVDDGLTLKLAGAATQSYEVQKSLALTNDWRMWLLVTNPPDAVILQDSSVTNAEKSFYRAISR